jgi:hypothetical protein
MKCERKEGQGGVEREREREGIETEEGRGKG